MKDLLNTIAIIVAVLFLIALEGCAQCVKHETRCQGDMVQVCNADERWEDVTNCAVIEPGVWTCVEGDTDAGVDTGTEPAAECVWEGDSDT